MTIRKLLAGVLIAGVVPAFAVAQELDSTSMTCADFTALGPEEQLAALASLNQAATTSEAGAGSSMEDQQTEMAGMAGDASGSDGEDIDASDPVGETTDAAGGKSDAGMARTSGEQVPDQAEGIAEVCAGDPDMLAIDAMAQVLDR